LSDPEQALHSGGIVESAKDNPDTSSAAVIFMLRKKMLLPRYKKKS